MTNTANKVRQIVAAVRAVLFGLTSALTVVEMAPADVVPDRWHGIVALLALMTHAAVVGIDNAEGTN